MAAVRPVLIGSVSFYGVAALVTLAGVVTTGGSCSPLALRQHGAGLLAGAGVDEVVAEEDLRGRSTGSAMLGHVVRGDVDGGVVRLLDELDGNSLAVPQMDVTKAGR